MGKTTRTRRLPPIQAIRAFAKLRRLTFAKARRVFYAEVIEGRHSPQGIRFHVELGGSVPALVRPEPEDVPKGSLMLAEGEDGFDDEFATITITALEIEYHHVTYFLDDEAASATAVAVDDTAASPAAQEAATPVPRLTLEQIRELTPEQTKQRHKQALSYRETAVKIVRGAGKVPTKNGYTEPAYVREVRALCGLDRSETVRGFDRKTLRGIFKSLKD